MIVADTRHIGQIMKLLPDTNEAVLAVTSKIRAGMSVYLLNDEGTACVNYDPLYAGKWVAHIVGLPETRGKELWDFAYSTAVWMVDKHSLSQLICFVSEDNRKLRMFVSRFRMKCVGDIENERIYFASQKQIKDFRR